MNISNQCHEARLRERIAARKAKRKAIESTVGQRFEGGLIRVEDAHEMFRSIRFCDGIISLRHRGWYLSDLFQDEVARGVVLSMPTGQFAAGIADPHMFNWDRMKGPCVVDTSEWFDNETDAARHADRIAEIYAEREREFEETENAKLEVEEAQREEAERAYWAERDVMTVE